MTPTTYRMPEKPAYLGSYQWPTVAAGLLAIPLISFLCTQLLADHFHYHRDLGDPLYRIGLVGIYQPFGWLVWLFRFGNSSDPAISRPIYFAAMAAVLGSVFVALLASGRNMRRTRQLSDNLGDLHGSAKWATPQNVHESGLTTTTGGVYVGGWYDRDHNRLHYLRHNGKEHILAFAPPRSGKGVGLVIPTLLAWAESVVVYDIKGENWAKTAGFREQAGHICFKLSPTEDGTSSRFNPLAEIRLHTPRDVSDAQNISDILVRPGENTPTEPYWYDAAASLNTGMILHVCYAADAQGRVACPHDLADIYHDPDMTFKATLEKILNYEHDPTARRGWKTHPTVREKVREMLNKLNEDFSSVLSVATTALSIFSDPLVAANTATSDFRINDLVNHDKPVSLYIVVPPSDTIRLRPLVRLLFTIIVNRLTERLEFQGSSQLTNRHQLLFLIDEFPTLKRMELFSDALSYMAGFNLKAYLIAQDICQITKEYGANQSIVSTCNIRVAFAPNNFETAELLSKMTGEMTVEKAGVHYSGKRSGPVLPQVSTSLELVRRPLLTPDEVQRLRPPKKSGAGVDEKIVAPGDMLIFHAGYYPIYGTQMLYFTDPELARRSSLAPPTARVAISPDGSIIPQPAVAAVSARPPDQPSDHVLSPPELITEEAPKHETPPLPGSDDDDFWIN